MGQWVPIVAPIGCNYYAIIGNFDGSAMMRCSDPNDANTEYEIPAGGGFALFVPPHPPNLSIPRYSPGSVVTYLMALSGVGPVICEFFS